MVLQRGYSKGNGSATSHSVPFGQARGSVEKVRDVLVVDDDAAVLRLVKVAFQGSGVAIKTAANGREALEQLSSAQADAIVLDLEMPVMDGRAFYRELRRRGVNTPVLILSAFDARRACRELHADAFMSKPFDPDALLTAVVELVDSRDH